MTKVTVQAEEAQSLPRPRVAGSFYLLTFVAGGIAAFSDRLVVDGDAAATAANILAHQSLFWLGFAAYLMVVACYVVVTALFYELFRPVSKSLSLLAAFFSLVGCAIQATICVVLSGRWPSFRVQTSVLSRVNSSRRLGICLSNFSGRVSTSVLSFSDSIVF